MNEAIEQAPMSQTGLADALQDIDEYAGSYVKYEFIKKRDAKSGKQKKILQAKRCSMRHKCLGFDPNTSANPIKSLVKEHQPDSDVSFEYNPS